MSRAPTSPLIDALDERVAIMVHEGGLSPATAEALAAKSVPYYLHREDCAACRSGSLCATGAPLWRTYAKAAREVRG